MTSLFSTRPRENSSTASIPAVVNDVAGIVSWLPGGQPFSIMAFTIKSGKIVEIDVLGDPASLRQLDLTFLKD